jgi:hypothetical protein
VKNCIAGSQGGVRKARVWPRNLHAQGFEDALFGLARCAHAQVVEFGVRWSRRLADGPDRLGTGQRLKPAPSSALTTSGTAARDWLLCCFTAGRGPVSVVVPRVRFQDYVSSHPHILRRAQARVALAIELVMSSQDRRRSAWLPTKPATCHLPPPTPYMASSYFCTTK